MNSDPFHRKIVVGLEGTLDGNLFEACVSDLLREAWPGLVPVRGGNDAGMDGAIADGRGVAFPLVTTTAKSVIGNLTRSLNAYKDRGGDSKRVVVATSQALTAPQRRNLKQRAHELGFSLVQIHARDDIANRLYRESKWCLELLGLMGKPLPLSILPKSSRPKLGDILIGRDDDLKWLRCGIEDALLVGQPGCGKTFLLEYLARQGEGLFLIAESPKDIANGIRDQQPSAVFVDDAHVKLETLSTILHLRDELGAKFRVVATCWPGDEDHVTKCLRVTPSGVRGIALLTQEVMLDVIKSCGIYGPKLLLHELIKQAMGRPGLAATLCFLCINGDIRQIASGEALFRDINTAFQVLIGDSATVVMGCFALGGKQGMSMSAVSGETGMPEGKIRNIVVKLAAGGVLRDIGDERLAVIPSPLRQTLVGEVFFRGAASLNWRRLAVEADDPDEVTLTLIGAKGRGAKIPESDMRKLLETSRRPLCWRAYASLGRRETEWVLEKHPEQLISIARVSLSRGPEKAVPMLIELSVGDERTLNNHTEHPMRILTDWVAAARPGTPEPLQRRQLVFRLANKWLLEGGNQSVWLKACEAVFSTSYMDHSVEPGNGYAFTFTRGKVTREDVRELGRLWKEFVALMGQRSIEDWKSIKRIIVSFDSPSLGPVKTPDDVYKEIRKCRRIMLVDVAGMAQGKLGMLHWIKQYACSRKHRIKIDLPSDFEALYPARERSKSREQEKLVTRAARRLAKQWISRPARTIADRLVYLHEEAKLSNCVWPRGGPIVCTEIARMSNNLVDWLNAFFEAKAPVEFLGSFIKRIASEKPHRWESILDHMLESDMYRPVAIHVVLSTEGVSDSLITKVCELLEEAEGAGEGIRISCMYQRIPAKTIKRLLGHERDEVVGAAACGVWNAEEGNIPEELHQEWRRGIIRCPNHEHVLGEIFERDHDLAKQWLSAELIRNRDGWLLDNKAVNDAISVLNHGQRLDILEQCNIVVVPDEVINRIIGDDIQLYKDFLEMKELKDWHLVPLQDMPNDNWADKAILALDGGYSEEEICRATYGGCRTWSGPASRMWTEWADAFSVAKKHDDVRIKRIGELGARYAQSHRDVAFQGEEHEAIYGEE